MNFVLWILIANLARLVTTQNRRRQLPLPLDLRPALVVASSSQCLDYCKITRNICGRRGLCYFNRQTCEGRCLCRPGYGGQFCRLSDPAGGLSQAKKPETTRRDHYTSWKPPLPFPPVTAPRPSGVSSELPEPTAATDSDAERMSVEPVSPCPPETAERAFAQSLYPSSKVTFANDLAITSTEIPRSLVSSFFVSKPTPVDIRSKRFQIAEHTQNVMRSRIQTVKIGRPTSNFHHYVYNFVNQLNHDLIQRTAIYPEGVSLTKQFPFDYDTTYPMASDLITEGFPNGFSAIAASSHDNWLETSMVELSEASVNTPLSKPPTMWTRAGKFTTRSPSQALPVSDELSSIQMMTASEEFLGSLFSLVYTPETILQSTMSTLAVDESLRNLICPLSSLLLSDTLLKSAETSVTANSSKGFSPSTASIAG